eukprot:TRINITY_DN16537_c0_g1_i2.p1 TRINITY_DN16537_c0_g1~~TRINITY_DN16537_c0_g1_i2.p1  ORF type:complete len:431 (-),score=104.23 TRINITY_DN16537_c0_g1_i2:312-1604(-)
MAKAAVSGDAADGLEEASQWARAICDYEPADEGCLKLVKEQWIWLTYVGENDDAGWNYGTNEDGSAQGWFPADVMVWDDGQGYDGCEVYEQSNGGGEDYEDYEDDKESDGDTAACTTAAVAASRHDLVSVPASIGDIIAGASGRGNAASRGRSAEPSGHEGESDSSRAHSAPAEGRAPIRMVHGREQAAEARRQAALGAAALDEREQQAIAERRALSVERREKAEAAERSKKDANSELQAVLARRRGKVESGEPSSAKAGEASRSDRTRPPGSPPKVPAGDAPRPERLRRPWASPKAAAASCGATLSAVETRGTSARSEAVTGTGAGNPAVDEPSQVVVAPAPKRAAEEFSAVALSSVVPSAAAAPTPVAPPAGAPATAVPVAELKLTEEAEAVVDDRAGDTDGPAAEMKGDLDAKAEQPQKAPCCCAIS